MKSIVFVGLFLLMSITSVGQSFTATIFVDEVKQNETFRVKYELEDIKGASLSIMDSEDFKVVEVGGRGSVFESFNGKVSGNIYQEYYLQPLRPGKLKLPTCYAEYKQEEYKSKDTYLKVTADKLSPGDSTANERKLRPAYFFDFFGRDRTTDFGGFDPFDDEVFEGDELDVFVTQEKLTVFRNREFVIEYLVNDVSYAYWSEIPDFGEFDVEEGPITNADRYMDNGVSRKVYKIKYILKPQEAGSFTIPAGLIEYSGITGESPAIEIVVVDRL